MPCLPSFPTSKVTQCRQRILLPNLSISRSDVSREGVEPAWPVLLSTGLRCSGHLTSFPPSPPAPAQSIPTAMHSSCTETSGKSGMRKGRRQEHLQPSPGISRRVLLKHQAAEVTEGILGTGTLKAIRFQPVTGVNSSAGSKVQEAQALATKSPSA